MSAAPPWKRREVIGEHALYLGDCRDIMPTLGRTDAVVSDPPYGIGYRPGGGEKPIPASSARRSSAMTGRSIRRFCSARRRS